MGLSIGNIRSTLGGIQVPRGLPEGGQPFVGFNSRAQAAGKERFVPKFLGQREDKLVTRVGFGPLRLGHLKEGAYRPLSERELTELQNLVTGKPERRQKTKPRTGKRESTNKKRRAGWR